MPGAMHFMGVQSLQGCKLFISRRGCTGANTEDASADSAFASSTINSNGRNEMQQGVVGKWNNDRGYGFIKPDEGGPDLFVHISKAGGQSLVPGLRVKYDVGEDQSRRPCARNVSVI